MTVIEATLTTQNGERAVLIKNLPDALFEVLKAEFPGEPDDHLWRVVGQLIVQIAASQGIILE